MMRFQVWKVIAALSCDNRLPTGSTGEVFKAGDSACPLPSSLCPIAHFNKIKKTPPPSHAWQQNLKHLYSMEVHSDKWYKT